jgi:predicted O-linked N-acetylglucosamine transferase (SPINDLY family)
MDQYGQVDIALDPFPYNGTTTTCDALWMGVPVITLRGDRHAGRVGASLLSHVGLTALIAESLDDYVAKAAALAADLDRLTALRAALRQRLIASPIGDPQGFARTLEGAYRDLWHRWCAR